MYEIKIFEGHNVEVIELNGQILFNPYNVGECLGLTDSAVRMAITKMSNKQVRKLTNSDVNNLDTRKLNNAGENFLTESGVYKIVFKSHKENAERFQDWVTDEVLPSLRKYGSYTMQKPDSYMIVDEVERAKRWIEEAEERRKLALTVKNQEEEIAEKENKIRQQEPLVHFAKTVASTEDCIDMNNMAKLIGQKTGISVGRNKLFAILRNNKFLMYDNQPYQKYIEDGTFTTLEYTYMKSGEARIGLKTLVTGKGQIKICKFIKRYAENLLANCSVTGKEVNYE